MEVYANKPVQGGGNKEDLHYMDVRCVMLHTTLASKPGADFIRGMNSKTAVYAQICLHQAGSRDGEPQEENIDAETVSSGQTGAREEGMAERSVERDTEQLTFTPNAKSIEM